MIVTADAVEWVIAAWLLWEQSPRSPAAVERKLAAIKAAGLDSCRVHERIAAARRSGLSIPDAVQTVVNDDE